MSTTHSVLSAWHGFDDARALGAADRRAIDASATARVLVLEGLTQHGDTRDLFSACARLGRILAESGASPTLASGCLEGALRALKEYGIAVEPEVLSPARAALFEGFVAHLHDRARADVRESWAPPGCMVPLGNASAAIACGHPEDDDDALARWSERVALSLQKAGVRRAILGGHPKTIEHARTALAMLGIESRDAVSALTARASILESLLSAWRTWCRTRP